jgi:hypothetical protein
VTDPNDLGALQFGAWTSADEEALIRDVAASNPDLLTALGVHVEEEDGAVLSTYYLSVVARWAIEQFVHGDRSRVETLLAVLEAHLERGDDYVRELVGVGFVENLDPPDSAAGAMRNLLGPQLSAEYALTYPGNP